MYLFADPDGKADYNCRNGSYGDETDPNRTSNEHRQLQQDLLLAAPLLLAPERAPRRTAVMNTIMGLMIPSSRVNITTSYSLSHMIKTYDIVVDFTT